MSLVGIYRQLSLKAANVRNFVSFAAAFRAFLMHRAEEFRDVKRQPVLHDSETIWLFCVIAS